MALDLFWYSFWTCTYAECRLALDLDVAVFHPPPIALEANGAELEGLLKPVLEPYPVTLVRQGSIFWLAFQQPAPRSWGAVDRSGADRYKVLHRAMLERGVYMAPSAYEVGFVSAAHESSHLQHTAKAMGEALALAFQETA